MNLTFSFSLSASFCSAFAFHSAKNCTKQTEFNSSQYSSGAKIYPDLKLSSEGRKPWFEQGALQSQ